MTVSLIDVSTYLPENRVPAEWYAKFAGTDDLRDNLMFRAPEYRHHAAFEESNTDMIVRATEGLVARHEADVLADVDVLLTHSQLPDLPIVGSGGEVAHRLGIDPEYIVDVHNGGCAAFVQMLKLARQLLLSGAGRTALIACAQNAGGKIFEQEQVRKLAQSSVPGDGAAVGLLTLSDSSPILDIECRYYGEYAGDMTLASDPPRLWWQAGPGEGYVSFNEAKIMKVLARGNREVPEVALAVCDRIGMKSKDVDLLVTNQPNRVFLRNWNEALEIPRERHRDTFHECGNLFAVGIPVNFEAAINDGQVKAGDVVLMAGFAHAGDFAGAAAIRWGRSALMTTPKRALTDAVGALPVAVNPLALSLNENPFPPLPAVRSALMASVDVANRYPEFLPERLRSLIAEHEGVGGDQVVIGAGATGVIMQVLHAVTSPGDKLVMTSPTFDGYPIFAQMARLAPVIVGLDAHGHHDLDAMAEAAHGARVVAVCRPHNPTGTIESAADIEQFLRRVPADTVVLLDEAYAEFLAPEHRLDAPALVKRFPNVVVLRTFSKAYGLAGMRIGYGFCAPDLSRELWAMQLPFGVGITSLVAVAASYDAESQLRQRIRMISSERRYLAMRLRSMGVYSTDGHANFVYLPAGDQPWPEVFDGGGLRVRGYADGGVRITIGNRQSTRAVLNAVRPITQR